jgi:hypothetical protein
MVESALEESWFEKEVKAQSSLSSLVHTQCAPAAVKECVQLNLGSGVMTGGHCLEDGKPEWPVHYRVLVAVVLFVADHDDESLLEKVTESVTGAVIVYRDFPRLRLKKTSKAVGEHASGNVKMGVSLRKEVPY